MRPPWILRFQENQKKAEAKRNKERVTMRNELDKQRKEIEEREKVLAAERMM